MKLSRELIAGLLAAVISVILLSGSLILSLVEDQGSQKAHPTQIVDLYPTIPSPVSTLKLAELAVQSSPSPVPAVSQTEILQPAECKPPEAWNVITVSAGETLVSLAELYDIPVQTLMDGNCLAVDILKAGMTIHVPQVIDATPTITTTPTITSTLAPGECRPPDNWIIYSVRRGDTLYSISRAHGITVQEIKEANCLTSNNIVTGKRLYVPDPQAAPTHTPNP